MYTRKLTVALALLLVCLILLLSASYAWISMAVRPEVNGIDTHIGANGSLEIALLTRDTFVDPSLIRTQIGDSAARQDAVESNKAWGNVVELSGEGYGLDKISMYPARLNVTVGSEGVGKVNNNMLVYAEYGLDGRISQFFEQTASGIYQDGQFSYDTTQQNYGVRGIGTALNMTPQQAALAKARTAVPAYASAAKSEMRSAWEEHGQELLTVFYKRYSLGYDQGYDNGDVAAIVGTAEHALISLNYCEAMLEQYLLGYAASEISNADQFNTIKSTMEYMDLYDAISMLPVSVPSEFKTLVEFLEYKRACANGIILGCRLLKGGNYSWPQLEAFVAELLPREDVYLNDWQLSSEDAFLGLSGTNVLTIYGSNGLLSSAILFCGTYDGVFDFDTNVTVRVETVQDKAFPDPVWVLLKQSLDGVVPAGASGVSSGKLTDICGYAVDLSFRCNEQANLLLQTDPEIRVDNGGQDALLQGGGSSMKFTSEQLDPEQILMLMDGMRIAFLDVQGQVLCLARLNTSNYEESKDGVSAPLYLYEFRFSDAGGISLGERMDKNSAILELPQNAAAIVTVVVWLDGDYVDNSLASTSGMSVTGSLNLQFSTDAELVASSQYADGT